MRTSNRCRCWTRSGDDAESAVDAEDGAVDSVDAAESAAAAVGDTVAAGLDRFI